VGIKIDTLQISKYQVSGLYIKLDKKLTLKADKVTIPKRKANPSFNRIDETLEGVKYLLTFFDMIDLKEIHFDNNILGIHFRKNILQISSKDYLIRGNVYREGTVIKGDIPVLYLKEKEIILRGSFSYDLTEDILVTEGKFALNTFEGDFTAHKKDKFIDFALKSGTFSDLKSVIDKFSMPATVKSWVVDKVQAKNYKLHYLMGKGSIENGTFKMDMPALQGEVLFSDVKIDFKEGLAPVLAPEFTLSYTDDNGLFFDLYKPTYLGKNLEGSSVSIVNLRDDNTTLKLNLKVDSRFDKEVQNLLNAYNITIPVLQKNGNTYAAVDIDIGLKKKYTYVVTDANFTQGDVVIQEVSLPVVKGGLHYEEGVVTLENMILENKYYAGRLNGKIDLKAKKLQGIFDTKYIKIGKKKDTLVSLKNEKLPFTLSYKKELTAEIPKLSLDFQYKNKEAILKIADLHKVKKYITDNIPIDEGGNVKIVTKDFKTYYYNGKVKRKACFLYEKENVCATRVIFEGKATPKNVSFNAFNKRLFYDKTKSRIKLKNLNIDLKKFLEQEKKSTIKKPNKSKKLVILGTNSHLRYGDYTLVTDSYDVEIKSNGNIKAIGSSEGDIIKFTKVKDIISLQALRIKDKALHPLINFKGLKNGRYSIVKKGNPKEVMKGEIIIEGGVMKDFKAYNNTLAFINTLPALATLHNPGYSNEGFNIDSGVINYRMIKGKKIVFDSIYIKGKSATIVGKGELDLKNKTINIELGIQVARELGKVIGSIPLVGYILVGKDKSMTVGLSITGNLDKPIAKVSAAKDILSYPLLLIKRTIESPQHLLAPETLK